MKRLFLLSIVLGLVVGCGPSEDKDGSKDDKTTTESNEPKDVWADRRLTRDEVTPEIQADMDKTVPAVGEVVVAFDTSLGRIVVMLYEKVAPKTVANFKKLVGEGFYNGTRFHRCIPEFMIQGGDPNSKDLDASGSWGTGGPGYMIEDELNPIAHSPGVLSMAHSGPNTGGSQFFLMDSVKPHLDYVHTAFGKVVGGQDVVAKIIATGDATGAVAPERAVVINKATLESWPVE
jgi:peptidyl-prolyl cis-trans isomerase B (cyclophilin B)